MIVILFGRRSGSWKVQGNCMNVIFFFYWRDTVFPISLWKKRVSQIFNSTKQLRIVFPSLEQILFSFVEKSLGIESWEWGIHEAATMSVEMLVFFFFFFGLACGMWKFLGQGLNLCHSSDLSCCSNNGRSLTHCTSRELQREFQLWLSGLRTWCCLRENAGSIPGLTQWVKGPMLPLLWLWCRPQLQFQFVP